MRIRLRTALIEERMVQLGKVAVTRRAQVDRTTLWRWLQKGLLPKDSLQFLRLATALDIDPVLLFELDPLVFPQLCSRIIGLVRNGSWSKFMPAIAFVEGLVVPAKSWPAQSLAPEHSCHWHRFTFTHCPEVRAHYYAALIISPGSLTPPRAQAWHFAYRNLTGDRPWIPWGLVTLVNEHVELYNYDGTMKSALLSSVPFVVETWFGGGAAEFCVASLHPFSLSVRDSTPEGLSVVRFE